MKRAPAFGAIVLFFLAACGRKEEPPKPAARTEEKAPAKPPVLTRVGAAERTPVPASSYPTGLSFDGCSVRIRYEDGRADTYDPDGRILKTEPGDPTDLVAKFMLDGVSYEVIRAPRTDSNYCYATGQWGAWQVTRKTWTADGANIATLPGSYNIIREGEAFPATTALQVDAMGDVTAITEVLVHLGKDTKPAVQASAYLYTLIEDSRIVDQGTGIVRLAQRDGRVFRILQPSSGGFSVSIHPSRDPIWTDQDHGDCEDILADGRILARKPEKDSDRLYLLHPRTGKVEAERAAVPKQARPVVSPDGSAVATVEGRTVRLSEFGSAKSLGEHTLPDGPGWGVRGFCPKGDHYWNIDDRIAAVWTRGGAFVEWATVSFDVSRSANRTAPIAVRGRDVQSLVLISEAETRWGRMPSRGLPKLYAREWRLDLAQGTLTPLKETAGPIDGGGSQWVGGIAYGSNLMPKDIEIYSVPDLKSIGRTSAPGRRLLLGSTQDCVVVYEEGPKLLRVLALDGLVERSSCSAAWTLHSPQSADAVGGRMVVTGIRVKGGRSELAYKVVDIASSNGKEVRELKQMPLALSADGRRVLMRDGTALRFEGTDAGEAPVEVRNFSLSTALPRVDRSPSGDYFSLIDGTTLCVLHAKSGASAQVALDRMPYAAIFLSDDRVAVVIDNGVQVFEIK